MPNYSIFSAGNSYITPYASSIDGGELISEFNLRASLNVIGWKTVTIEELGITYESWLTGTRSDNDLKLTRHNSNLNISNGKFLIRGYYGELLQTLTVPLDDLITLEEVSNSSNNTVRKYIKIRVIVSPDSTTHGERLVPPVGNTYYGLDLVVDSVKPDSYDLLLGWLIRTNTKEERDNFTIVNNPLKSRILDLDKIVGAEKSKDWIIPPASEDGNIYGVKKGEEGSLIAISDWLWLAYNSPLGRYLRHFAWNAIDADNGYIGKDKHNGKMLGCLVSFAEEDSEGTPKMFRVYTNPDSYKIEYRVLKDGSKSIDAYDVKSLEVPLVTYVGRPKGIEKEVLGTDVVDGKAGLLSPSTLKYIDTILRGAENWSPNGGREFGPFQTTSQADTWFRGHKDTITPQFGDYYWVLDDVYKVEDTHKGNFGTVSGTAETVIMGTSPSSNASLTLSLPTGITGEVVVNDTEVQLHGVGQEAMVLSVGETTLGGTFNAEIPPVDVDLEFENQTVNFPVEVTLEESTGGTENPTPGQPNKTVLNGTASGSIDNVAIKGTTKRATTTQGNVTGTLNPTDFTWSAPEFDIKANVTGRVPSTMNFVPNMETISGQIGQLTVQATGQVAFNGKIDSYTQNVSARYVYIRDWDKELDAENPNPEPAGKWVRQCVLRGFATPATYEYYGFVRPNDNSVPGAVIMDETGHLKLRDEDVNALNMAGWKICTESQIVITPEGEGNSYDCPAALEGVWFLNPVTIILRGDSWNSDTVVPLNRIRGDVTLDITQASAQEGATALINCNDINQLTIYAGMLGNLTTNKINVTDCIVTTHNFNSIYRWKSSRFDSGSNIAVVDNPWVTIENPFTNDYDNSLQVRFVTLTRGEYGIISGELDVWVKIADWTTAKVNESVRLKSIEKLKFPPFLLKLDGNGNIIERQDVPSNSEMLLKISGTGGTHRIYQGGSETDDAFLLSGNFVSTVDWKNEDYFSLTGRVLNESGDRNHGLFDMRFRALVQFVDPNDPISQSVSYGAVYGTTD